MSARLTCSRDRSRPVGDYRAAHLVDNGWVVSQGNPSFRMQHKPKKFQPMQRIQSHRSLGFQLPAVNQNQEHEVSHHSDSFAQVVTEASHQYPAWTGGQDKQRLEQSGEPVA